MASRRRRLDPVGPFGNPDGSRADIEDPISEFVDFGGNPAYGQARWDVSTDLFAVGVLLYRLLCDGRHPFPNAMPMAGLPVTDPRTVRSDLDPDLAGFLITG